MQGGSIKIPPAVAAGRSLGYTCYHHNNNTSPKGGQTRTTKNNEGRSIYLNDTLLEVIDNQKRLGKEALHLCPHVFPNAKGSGKIKDWRKSWNAACRKAKLGYGFKKDRKYVARWQDKFPAGPTMHDFRRTSVRNNVRTGVPEAAAMNISGHKSRSVFDRYNIVNEADIKDGMCKAERYIQAQHGHNLGTIEDLATKKRS